MRPSAELWLTLARAFEPPTDRAAAQAFLGFLGVDLEEICAEAAFHPEAELASFNTAVTGIPNPDALLAHYSGLFLAPPVKARLNLGCYLDSTLNGDSQEWIEALLAHYGARRREAFHDLPDHLAFVCELMALLDGEADAVEDRRTLAHDIMLPALPRLAGNIAEHEPDSPYLALVQLAHRTLDGSIASTGAAREPAERRPVGRETPRGAWRVCGRCGIPYARESELRVIARALAESGLPADHLAFCPDCRDRQPGWAEAGRWQA